jgi:hypothetical protein
MKQLVITVPIILLLVLAALLHTSIRNFLWVHPWWHTALVAVPTLALALFGPQHSREANRLRAESNRLKTELDAERNRHLLQIAKNTKSRSHTPKGMLSCFGNTSGPR